MGYTTEFSGEFIITPALSTETLGKLELFLDERYDYDSFPSIHCDWEFSEDGTRMFWNGCEKAYEMTQWAAYLQNHFFSEHDIEGKIYARGEAFDDVWTMIADPKERSIYEEHGWVGNKKKGYE